MEQLLRDDKFLEAIDYIEHQCKIHNITHWRIGMIASAQLVEELENKLRSMRNANCSSFYSLRDSKWITESKQLLQAREGGEIRARVVCKRLLEIQRLQDT